MFTPPFFLNFLIYIYIVYEKKLRFPIDGSWVKHKKSFLVHDPFNNSKISKVFDAEESGTIRAINSAHDSFKNGEKYLQNKEVIT